MFCFVRFSFSVPPYGTEQPERCAAALHLGAPWTPGHPPPSPPPPRPSSSTPTLSSQLQPYTRRCWALWLPSSPLFLLLLLRSSTATLPSHHCLPPFLRSSALSRRLRRSFPHWSSLSVRDRAIDAHFTACLWWKVSLSLSLQVPYSPSSYSPVALWQTNKQEEVLTTYFFFFFFFSFFWLFPLHPTSPTTKTTTTRLHVISRLRLRIRPERAGAAPMILPTPQKSFRFV